MGKAKHWGHIELSQGHLGYRAEIQIRTCPLCVVWDKLAVSQMYSDFWAPWILHTSQVLSAPQVPQEVPQLHQGEPVDICRPWGARQGRWGLAGCWAPPLPHAGGWTGGTVPAGGFPVEYYWVRRTCRWVLCRVLPGKPYLQVCSLSHLREHSATWTREAECLWELQEWGTEHMALVHVH